MVEATGATDDAIVPRAVVGGAFGLLAALQGLGCARVSELHRRSGLPRTTVHRLLSQLSAPASRWHSTGAEAARWPS